MKLFKTMAALAALVGLAATAASAGPGTHSVGVIQIKQTFMADIDEGYVTPGPAADLWFEAASPGHFFLTPVHGAQFALQGTTQPDYATCQTAGYSGSKIPLSAAPVYTYVCVRTNHGRYAQFRIDGMTTAGPLKVLVINHRTWN
ncbi:MAG: hypothetical protein JSR45_16360 [Proteobacteria bacterium]|nr:hypothetical protein [Pseudomonadota bacterium]